MTIIPQCFGCRHFDDTAPRGIFRCDAYPTEIPTPILISEHDHKRPYPGDHGIHFEPKPTPPAK